MSTWMTCDLCGLSEVDPNVSYVTVVWSQDGDSYLWLCNSHA